MSPKLKPGEPAPTLSGTPVNQDTAVNVEAMVKDGPVVVVFSRYFGCPVCQSDFDKLVQAQDEITKHAKLVYVTQSSPDSARAFLSTRDASFPVLCDPAAPYPLYKTWGVGGISLVTLAKMGKVVMSKKYTHGEHEGNEKQSPADFVIAKGGTVTRVNHSLLDVVKILDALRQ